MCKIAHIYNAYLNAYQKLFGLSLRTSGTSKRSINKYSQLYDSVCYNTLTSLLDNFGEQSKILMANWANETVIHVGDNLDIRAQVRYEGQGVSYHELHLYNNMVYKSRIDVNELSDDLPEVQLDEIDYSQFILNADEEREMLSLMKYHILSNWKTHIDQSLKPIEPFVKHASAMASKTEKVSGEYLCIYTLSCYLWWAVLSCESTSALRSNVSVM